VTLRGHCRLVALILVAATLVLAARPSPAQAFNPLTPICDAASLASGLLGKACSVAQGAGRVVNAGKQLLGGHVGSAIKTVLGDGASAAGSGATAALGLAAIGAWVLGGAKFVLHEAAKLVASTTNPHLGTSWFSATYWRVAGIAALLTLPFLFAAAVQALTRSDLALLLRSVLGYLPLAMLAVTVAAPLTTLLLSASDQLSTLVSSATGEPGARALGEGIGLSGTLTLVSGSPFFVFFFALLTAVGAMALWMELLMREAAVYVVVLMLPLAFAALVWPARRLWAIRAVELLVALILSKFAIVAILALGGAAMDQVGHSLTGAVVGLVLVAMAAFSPWALLRLVPLAEVASVAGATLRGEVRGLASHGDSAAVRAHGGEEWAARTVAGMRRMAEDAVPPVPAGSPDPAGAGAKTEPDTDAPTPGPAGDDLASEEMTDPGAERFADGVGPEEGSSPAWPSGDSDPPPDPSGGQSPADRAERLPGLPPRWQAEDLSWRPLVLGTEEGWPPRLWPPHDDTSPQAPAGEKPGDDTTGLPPAELSPGLPPPLETPPSPPEDAA
jgi:hypothetical protein